METRSTYLVAVLAALLLAPAAAAHVEISPDKVQAGAAARFTIEVPTERKVPTIKIEVKLPSGLEGVMPEAKPGWKVMNRGGVLTWSGGKIGPGRSDTFRFKAAYVPGTPGRELVFPTIQTYATGPVERWIFGPGSETRAPRVMVEGGLIGTATETLDKSSDSHRGIAIAIGVGVLGGLLVLAFVLFRRRRA